MSIKHQIISVIILLILTSSALAGGLILCDNALNVLSDITIANFNFSHGTDAVTSGFFSEISHRIKGDCVTFMSFGEKLTVKHIEVTPVYTTYSLSNLINLNLKGDFFSEEQQNNNKRFAVISENLALELFFSTDVVGRTLELEEKNYIISGVYSENRGIVHNLSKDNLERIYLPYTCYHTPTSLDVDTLIYDSDSNSAAIIEQLDLAQYNFLNFASKSNVIDSLSDMMLLTLYMGALALFLFIWYKLSINRFYALRSVFSKYYFSEVVRTKPLPVILFILALSGIPAVFIAMYLMSDFSIYIPPEYIPYDNIFDIAYYFNEFLSEHSASNALALAGEKYFRNFYSLTFSSVIWLWLMFSTLYSLLISRVFRLLRDNVLIFQKN